MAYIAVTGIANSYLNSRAKTLTLRSLGSQIESVLRLDVVCSFQDRWTCKTAGHTYCFPSLDGMHFPLTEDMRSLAVNMSTST